MAKSNSPFRFDHREMTVIFSLFIFTSLLMFTVGIMVGKGLTQSKPEDSSEVAQTDTEPNEEKETSPQNKAPVAAGTSVSTDHVPAASTEPTHKAVSQLESVTSEVSEPSSGHKTAESKNENPKKELSKIEEKKGTEKSEVAEADIHPAPELELIPERPRTGDVRATLADLAETGEVNKALKNPKVQELIEDSPTQKPAPKARAKKRAVASIAVPSTPPKSFPEGKFTVQVGSYPSQADATLRLEQLRKQGFPYAYTSVKELGDKKEPWYRVWLGYFQDAESAKSGGELLQQRGEVKSYLVRKSETKED